MHKFTAPMLSTMVVLGLGTGICGAADPKTHKEVKPTLGERLTKHSVTGTLMRIEGEYFSVKDIGGRDVRLHVDQSTKLDNVAVGDKIKAYLTDEGHATTLQRE